MRAARDRAIVTPGRGTNRPPSAGPAWQLQTLREPRYSQSLERGLAILRCFTPEHPVWSVAGIADELGMTRSTTHRYMSTLVMLGFLEQDASRKYRLGVRVSDVGMSALAVPPLRTIAHPCLERLRNTVSYMTAIAILANDEILVVDALRDFRGYSPDAPPIRVGSRLPAYCTSMGKVLMAHLSDPECRGMLSRLWLTRRGPQTITSKHLLTGELLKVRDVGLATDDEELSTGMLSIAMPVRSSDGEIVGAVSITAPKSRIPLSELIDGLGPHLLSTASRISVRLGQRQDDNTATDS
jgi:IclR family pca regulon transcriptional regulator